VLVRSVFSVHVGLLARVIVRSQRVQLCLQLRAGQVPGGDVSMLTKRRDDGPNHQYDSGEVNPEYECHDEPERTAEDFGPGSVSDVRGVKREGLLGGLPQDGGEESSDESTSRSRMRLRHKVVELKKHGRREEEGKEKPRNPDGALPQPLNQPLRSDGLSDDHVVDEGGHEHR